MASATMQGVGERVQSLANEVVRCRAAHEQAERRLKELDAIREQVDAEAYYKAQVELPSARARVYELAADALLVEVELKDARERARESIARERTPGRMKLIDKFHRALIEARDCRRDLLAFDAETERLLDGRSAGQSPAWAQLEELDSWRKAIA